MENKENLQKMSLKQKGIERILKYLEEVLDKYMKQFPKYNELKTFMAKGNLYDEDGKPLKEYQEWIAEFNEHCKKHSFETTFKKEIDKEKAEMMEGVKEFLEDQRKLMESYQLASDKEAWLNSVLDSEKKRQMFKDLIMRATEHAFDDSKEIS